MNNSALQLYRKILKTHQTLPKTMKDLGNKYLRQEFKSHLYPKVENFKFTHYETFLKSWQTYLSDMQDPSIRTFGKQLTPDQLSALNTDQKRTLNNLKSGGSKPKPPS